MKFKARDYQKECLAKITQAAEQGKKRALVVMAPGLGKTITSAFAVKEFFAGREFSRVLILCHSEEILRQSKEEYQKFFGEEYSYGMFVSNEKATRQTDFLFATFQTMKDNRKGFPKEAFAYIIVDEAHHSKARTYFPTIRYFKPEFLLGLTATPDRLDGQKIEEIYGDPVYELDFVEATCRGLLAECDYELVLDDLSQEDIDKYLDSEEKLSIAQLNKTIFAPKRDEEIVRLIKKYSAEQEDPKTMIFCKSIEHARRVTKLMGDGATLVHNGQSSSTNDIALDAFRDGKIRTIISVQMLNEGINVPDANVIVFLRNTVSPSVFYQQLGRGVRPAPGKKSVKVLDFVGNCERIQTILALKQEIDDFRTQIPVEKTFTHGDGEADLKEKFTLNIATPEFKSRMVNIVEMLDKAKLLSISWSKETAIIALREYADELGRTSITPQDIGLASKRSHIRVPSRRTLQSLFGNVKNAIIAAGLEYERDKAYTERGGFDCEADLFEAARLYAIELGHPEYLTMEEINANLDFPRWETLGKRYHGMGNFFKLAGLKRAKAGHTRYETKQAVRKALQERISSLGGKAPTKKQLRQDKSAPSDSDIRKFYPSYNAAIIDAGGEVNCQDTRGNYSDEAMAKQACQMQKELGRAPSITEWNQNPKTCSASILVRRYGTYNNAMVAYGVIPNPSHGDAGSRNEHDKYIGFLTSDGGLTDDAKQKLQSLIRRNKRKLRKSDLCEENNLPSGSFFHNNGWTLMRLNREVEAERIVSEIFLPGLDLPKSVIHDLQDYVKKVRRPLRRTDIARKQDGIVGIAYFRKRGITSVEIINCLVGSDAILAELDATN